jgi:hypothetical protein
MLLVEATQIIDVANRSDDIFVYLPLLLSDFLISRVILSPTLMVMSSYSLMLILNVGESVNGPDPMALEIFEIAFGKFFIMSSGEVNAIMFAPKGFSAPGL